MMGPWAWPVLNMQSDPYDRDSVLRAKCSVLMVEDRYPVDSAKSEILGSVLHGVHQFLTKHSALRTYGRSPVSSEVGEHRAPSTERRFFWHRALFYAEHATEYPGAARSTLLGGPHRAPSTRLKVASSPASRPFTF
jgi:hypothetical protein